MSLSPAYALQAAIYTALSNSTAVTSLLASYSVNGVNYPAIFDRVPQTPPFPFIHIGDHQLVGDIFQFSGSTDAHVNVHIFSRAQDKGEALTIESAVRDALELYLPVQGFNTDTYEYVSSLPVTDADGLTEHVKVEFRYGLTA